jgi:hypothetical protein
MPLLTTQTIDQSGTLQSLINVAAVETVIIQHDAGSTGPVVVTYAGGINVAIGDNFTVQDGATLIIANGADVNALDTLDIGSHGTLVLAAGLGADVVNQISYLGGTSGGDLVLDDGFSLSLLTGIAGFSPGDSLDLEGVAGGSTPIGVSDTFVGGLVQQTEFYVTMANSSIVNFALDGNKTGYSYAVAPDAHNGVVLDAQCYAEGTRILTAQGEKPVESLKPGEMVVLATGEQAPILFVGRRRIDFMRHPRPENVRPIRFRAGSLEDGVPRRDLLVSPDHAMFIDGVLVPAKDLVDGVSIAQESHCRSIRYFHIELAEHGVLLAEGAAAESFLNVGHRGLFDNADEPLMLHPDFMREREVASVAPLVTGGALLAAIRARLCARVAQGGFHVAERQGLRLLAGARVIAAQAGADGWRHFNLPAGVRQAVLSSDVFAPAQVDPASLDRRMLGVALTEVMLDGCPVAMETVMRAADLHRLEAGETARWTQGDVRLLVPEGCRRFSVRVVAWPLAWRLAA